MSYTLPSGTTAVPGQKILSARYNAAMNSIAAALNARRESTELQPAQYGGTGKDTSGTSGQPELQGGTWYFPQNHVNVKTYRAVGDGVTDDTAAIQAAIDVPGPHTVYFPTGTYILSDGGLGYSPWKIGMLVLNRDGIILEGPGTIRCPDVVVPLCIAGSTNVQVRGLTFYGYWDTDALYAMPAIRIGNYAEATADTDNVWVDGCTFRNTPSDAVYIGGSTESWDHLSRRIRLTNNYVDEGLCFLLASCVKGLIVDGLIVKHRTTVPPGPAWRLAQDEDIAVYSANGVDSENILVNNVIIDARGERTNPYTGYLKVHFGTSTGLIMSNVVLSNITILDNIGTIPEISGWYSAYCSVEISDADISNDSYTYSAYKNFVVSNLTLKNSGGLFCQCHGVQFNNISIDTAPADWPFHAIASQTAEASSECVFTNTKIANWPATGRVMSLEGEHITFNGLTVKDCLAEIFASENSTYTNFLIENSGNVSNGAFHVQNGSDYVVLGPGVFKDCQYVALHDSAGDPARGGTLRDVTFINNGTDTTIGSAVWNISGAPSPWVAVDSGGAEITDTTLYTPRTAGLHRVNYYAAIASAGAGGTVTVTITWNDGVGWKNIQGVLTATNVGNSGYVSGSVLIEAAVNQAILYGVSFQGVSGNPTYNLRVRLERIQ